MLQNKNAVIYGGGGAIGGAVARVFARRRKGRSEFEFKDGKIFSITDFS
jgi:hypothetical protein